MLCFSTLNECAPNSTNLTPGWALIQVNLDPIQVQEIGLKVGPGCSFVRLQYMYIP